MVVLRWGHRLRDQRLTTHVILTARALGGSGVILSDVDDRKIRRTVERVVADWGGNFFIRTGIPWRRAIEDWRSEEGIVVHLSAYGENVETSDVLERIKKTEKDVLVVVGSKKVPSEFFSEQVSDFNLAVGNQPHSECSSLAVFLDRYFDGKELTTGFKDARLLIVPSKRGKRLRQRRKLK